MLKNRILSTLKFFDLQDYPLTFLELHKFLLNDLNIIKSFINNQWELNQNLATAEPEPVSLDRVLECLQSECQKEVLVLDGFYCLPGREEIVALRRRNYFYGIKRERRIRKFLPFLRHMPFVRGVGVGGSQALGQEKEESDIDLLIITKTGFLWLARTLISFYFQVLGIRRHGYTVKNRFCLNHYLAVPKPVDRERNLYKAMEYLKLRPIVLAQNLLVFQNNNAGWIRLFFPNARFDYSPDQPQSKIQKFFEMFLDNWFGRFLEKVLKALLKPRIRQDEFTFVLKDELSFHPNSQHRVLLSKFFES